MRKTNRLHTFCLSALLLSVTAPLLVAQCDMLGEWSMVSREDWEDRALSGAYLGDYTGFPINAAGRQFADSWDASIESEPQRQAAPHTATYASRGPAGTPLRFSAIEEPIRHQTIGYVVTGINAILNRTIWLDGRAHPPAYAEHTWEGFSTGECVRGMLKVKTTHIKSGELRRNGVPSSSQATMTEYFIRHGETMTIVSFVEDPVYYDEPVVKTTDLMRNPAQNAGLWEAVEIGDEVFGTKRGWVPNYPLGAVHSDYSDKFGIPLEAVRGGKETIYPEYMWKVRKMISEKSAGETSAGNPAKSAAK